MWKSFKKISQYIKNIYSGKPVDIETPKMTSERWSMVDEYGDIDIPRLTTSTHINFKECRKHEPNVVFYDLTKHFECPKCKEEREAIKIDFLTESDMTL